MEFTKKLGAGFLGGEGFILQRLTGPGTCFLEIDGELTALDLEPGQLIKVDSGHIAAFEESVSYDIQFMSLKNIFLAGEGLALATLTGPGRVWLQHQTIAGLAGRLIPFLPKKDQNAHKHLGIDAAESICYSCVTWFTNVTHCGRM